MTRRAWLVLTTTSIAAAALAALNRHTLLTLQGREVARYLRKNFNYLKLDITDEELELFYESYKQHYNPIVRRHWHLLVKGRGSDYYKGRMDKLATTFLLSTDFFLNGARESQIVRYSALYHPYASPCWNPIFTAAARTDPVEYGIW